MSTGMIAAIIVVIVVAVILAAAGAGYTARKRKLRKRFGPEYDRVVAERQSRRLGEAELAERERRVAKLQLRELDDAARAKYSAEWADIQERFVDAPTEAITDAADLVDSVIRDCGYPDSEYDQTVADLSVQHASTLDHFRSAHEVRAKAESGQASTEELRMALLYYRELFSELLRAEVPTEALTSVKTPDPTAHR
jgi:hypothetical protein